MHWKNLVMGLRKNILISALLPAGHFLPIARYFALTEEGVAQIDPVVQEYGQAYVKLCQEAAPIQKTEEAAFCKRKKAAVRKIMAENDPGHPLMLGVFGEEKTEKVFEIVF